MTRPTRDPSSAQPQGGPVGLTRRDLLVGGAAATVAALSVPGLGLFDAAAAAMARAQRGTSAGSEGTLAAAAVWDTMSDTWVATDALGRRLPTNVDVGGARANRFVGIFYFTWLGQHTTTGPWDITKILAANPAARNDSNHPAWGPIKHFHHWGEPQFGYYLADDRFVIRKHAHMLADAGIDTIIVDTTNQHLYANVYHAVLDTFAQVRADGGTTPQLAFITPFGSPKQVVVDLYYDLYRPGTNSDLWFRWDGKPLILADPAALGADEIIATGTNPSQLASGSTQGQTFTATAPFLAVGARIPTWYTTTSDMTLSLYRGGPGGTLVKQQQFTDVADNAVVMLTLSAQEPAGTYYMQQSAPIGTIGWWTNPGDVYGGGQAYSNGAAVAGDRSLYLENVAVERATVIDVEAQKQPADLLSGQTLGQTFTTTYPILAAGGRIGTWYTTDSDVTLSLYRGGPGGALIKQQRFDNVVDNAIVMLPLAAQEPAGTYYLQLSAVTGRIAWWSAPRDVYAGGQAYANGATVAGDRSLFVKPAVGTIADIRNFFTFRKPQPSYFVGPTGPDQWGWLEDHPQHVFTDAAGNAEQVTVGVGQNITNGQLGAMSDATAQGRSFANETQPSGTTRTREGLNVQEQWNRALALDPEFVFVTGWNEWVAQRFDPATNPGIPAEGNVQFFDQFDWEHSRDIEPMIDGHGDDYYYQLIANVRRFKGVRAIPLATAPATITINGSFGDWSSVGPEFRDHIGDTVARNHPNWSRTGSYVNTTGRNDIVSAKVARNTSNVYFYVKTRAAITPYTNPQWMMLFLDTDGDPATGWEGFNFVVNRTVNSSTQTVLERSLGGWNWQTVGTVSYRVTGTELELAIPRSMLGLPADPLTLEFKWIDNMQRIGNILDTIDNGEAAPSGRFRYRYKT